MPHITTIGYLLAPATLKSGKLAGARSTNFPDFRDKERNEDVKTNSPLPCMHTIHPSAIHPHPAVARNPWLGRAGRQGPVAGWPPLAPPSALGSAGRAASRRKWASVSSQSAARHQSRVMHTTLLPLAPYALLPCWGLAPHHAQGTSQHSGGTGGRRRQHNHSHPLSLPPPPPTSSFSGEGGGRGAGGGSTTTASPSPYLLRNISPQQLHPGPNQQLPGQPGPHGPITSAAAEVTAVATAAAAAAAAGVTAVATAAAAAAAVAGSDGPVQSGGDQQVRGVEHIAAQWGRSDQDEAKRTLNSSLNSRLQLLSHLPPYWLPGRPPSPPLTPALSLSAALHTAEPL